MEPNIPDVIFIFVLAIFVGIEVISKVPSMLHTPLMSGTNAIHGIILFGGILVLADASTTLAHETPHTIGIDAECERSRLLRRVRSRRRITHEII